MKEKKKISLLFPILFAVLILYSVILFALFIWGFLTAMRENLGFISDPFGFEGGLHIDNFEKAFFLFQTTVKGVDGGYRTVYIEEMFLNSLIYSFGCSLVNTFVTCVVAYVASKFDYKICGIISTMVIVLLALPIVGNLPAEISMAKMLNIYGTMGGMFIMRAAFIGPYFLIFAAVFKGVPKDFTEAGYIDGANEFTIFFNLMMPMVKDTFMTVMLLSFIGYWNDYSVPLIYLPDNPPLALGLYRFNASTDNEISTVPMKMAGCFIVSVPILIIFVAFQNKLMGNISMGGLKE
ncbi:MAG: carbohydrate ABC transporter permease [Candidatus Borkfalkiaceae bacterium]|nr:carbohydrate ABC transporter permease [Christensenellaceae bacterium]